jgi:hypothetical protein
VVVSSATRVTCRSGLSRSVPRPSGPMQCSTHQPLASRMTPPGRSRRPAMRSHARQPTMLPCAYRSRKGSTPTASESAEKRAHRWWARLRAGTESASGTSSATRSGVGSSRASKRFWACPGIYHRLGQLLLQRMDEPPLVETNHLQDRQTARDLSGGGAAYPVRNRNQSRRSERRILAALAAACLREQSGPHSERRHRDKSSDADACDADADKAPPTHFGGPAAYPRLRRAGGAVQRCLTCHCLSCVWPPLVSASLTAGG